MQPKQSSEFHDPSSSNFLHIVLQGVSIVIKAKSKRDITRLKFNRNRSKVNQVI